MKKEQIAEGILGTAIMAAILPLGIGIVLSFMNTALEVHGSVETFDRGKMTAGISIGRERFSPSVFPSGFIKQIKPEELRGWKFNNLGVVIIFTNRPEVAANPSLDARLAR